MHVDTRSAPLVVGLLAASCLPSCGGELPSSREPAEWLDVGSAPVHERPFVPAERRDAMVEFHSELTIGGRNDDPHYAFGAAPPRLAVTGDGRVYAADDSLARIMVYGPGGDFLFTFGRPGEGPGEINWPWGRPRLGFLDGRLFIFHKRERIGFWTLEGEFLEERTQERLDFPAEAPMVNVGPGELLSFHSTREGRGRVEWRVGRYTISQRGLQQKEILVRAPAPARPAFAVAADGRIWMADFDTYGERLRLTGMGPDGTVRWVVRVPWPRDLNQQVVLRVDGAGRLWMIPFPRPEASHRLVDVYGPDGERLLSGWMPNVEPVHFWQLTVGDSVWGVDADPETLEWRVVETRVELPSG